MKRYPFLDWLRGLAILIMIQCHTFNSFTKADLRPGGPYLLSQFVGGMAGPLFLFMAGMTSAFGIERAAAREAAPLQRWLTALRRAGYVLAIAYLFRFTNWLFSLPHADWHELTKVDILNCMGAAMLLFSACAAASDAWRVRLALIGTLVIAAVSPLIASVDWNHAPALLHDYLAPPNGTGRFPIFPYAAFLGFGLAIGAIVKRTAAERLDRLMQWSVIVGLTLILTGQYFAGVPYSLYQHSDFWSDSPTLVCIRLGVVLALLSASYLWTAYRAAPRWSWLQTIGRNSLMVYWVHLMLVYGDILKRFKAALNIPQTALAALTVTILMVALSVVWFWWKGRAVTPAAYRAAAAPGEPT